MNKEKRIEILTRLRDDNPEPTTELDFSSPFELLIAVLLSAQSTDVGVNKATAKLYLHGCPQNLPRDNVLRKRSLHCVLRHSWDMKSRNLVQIVL